MTPGTKVIALPFEERPDGFKYTPSMKKYSGTEATVRKCYNDGCMVIQFDDGIKLYWPTSALKPIEPNAPEQTILQELEQMQTKLNGIIKRLKDETNS